MDDNDNDVCPLCCEELDISDRQFFPCKCGYQVCMWCWHRIKESESGLCPACRTPYGDDPHEFSAVDMEDVVKANKEKAAAEKREKERLRQQQAAAIGGSMGLGMGGSGVAGMHIGGGSDGDLAVATSVGSRGHLEPPKDRNQLANMRVIRRNLVYAVGLPPSLATEEILRKPENFGQYGKVSKIVLNRNHNGNGDPRRASASAYVTFAHKEDALACILALDGYYVDARNVRASYGTSKYCSAFIKNVRCNNPDCTYLHCMGDSEDTFTKQEIQAGYVTSGRDVLAKQQQLAAATSGSTSRRRVGSGGPSGTGKVASNPVFPPPIYDQPSKPAHANLVPPPPSTSSTAQFPPVGSTLQRSSTSTGSISGFSSVAAGGKMVRASSLPGSNIASQHTNSTTATKAEVQLTPAEILSRQQEQLRKLHPQNNSVGNSSTTETNAPTPSQAQSQSRKTERSKSLTANTNTATATAASVVAGVHSISRPGPTQPAPHTTLTALTPLKRANSLPDKKDGPSSVGNKTASMGNDTSMEIQFKALSPAEQAVFTEQQRKQKDMGMNLTALRSNSTSLGISNASVGGTASSSPSSSVSSANGNAITSIKLSAGQSVPTAAGSIGSMVIGNKLSNANPGNMSSRNAPSVIGAIGSNDTNNNSIIGKGAGLGSIGGASLPIGGHSLGNFGRAENSGRPVGGGDLFSSSMLPGGGGSNSQWNQPISNPTPTSHLFGNPEGDFGAIGGAGIWGNEPPTKPHPMPGFQSSNNFAIRDNSQSFQPAAPGGGFLGHGSSNGNVSGSSALASMLGIELPTGVGSLRDSLWESSTPVRTPMKQMKSSAPTPIGSGIKKSNDGLIIGGGHRVHESRGVPIGGMYNKPRGGNPSNGEGNTHDMALLQSLLPGVHITSGTAYQPAAPNANGKNNVLGGAGWGAYPQPPLMNNHNMQKQQNVHTPMGMDGLRDRRQQQGGDTWDGGNFYSSAPGAPNNNNAQKQGQSNIW